MCTIVVDSFAALRFNFLIGTIIFILLLCKFSKEGRMKIEKILHFFHTLRHIYVVFDQRYSYALQLFMPCIN